MLKWIMNDNKEVERIMKFVHELIEERDQLKRWKEEMLQVEAEWDCQMIGKLLNIGLGQSIRKNIEPKIRELIVLKLWMRLRHWKSHGNGVEL
jgi:hypothetical protein